MSGTFVCAFPVPAVVCKIAGLPQERIFQLASGMHFKDLVLLVEL